MKPEERNSLIATVVAVVLMVLLAWASSHNQWILWLAVSVGSLGGLVHEIAQSGGKIMFLKNNKDGLYLGSLSGMILGAVAGILVVRGHVIASTTGAALSISTIQLSYEVFTAGLALKGVAEAVSSNQVPLPKED